MTVSLNGTSGVTFSDASTQNTAATGFGFKNRLINGSFEIAQRASSATVTAGTGVPTTSTGYPCVDRWFVYSTGANVAAAYVTGVAPNPHMLQITGATSVTAVGVGQRIEANNSADLAGNVCTLSVDIANTQLTTVTWTASYANTADTFGTIGTPTKTQIATGTFTVTSTMTRYRTNITIPSAATTGIEILFTVGAQTAGTWQLDNAQLEKGATATSFDTGVRPYGTELALCQRYYACKLPVVGGGATNTTIADVSLYFPITMRTTPTIALTGVVTLTDGAANYTQSSASLGAGYIGSEQGGFINAMNNFTGMTAYRPLFLNIASFNNPFTASAEL